MTIEKMLGVVFVLAASALFGSVSAQCLTSDDNSIAFETDYNSQLEQARFDFALDTLSKTAQAEQVDNIFYSPHSLHEALTLAYFSARGTTEEGLKRALRVPAAFTKTHVQRFYNFENALRRQAEAQGDAGTSYEFRTANKLWVTKERHIRDCMIKLFSNQLSQIDFRADPEAIRQRVNDWARNETRGHIRDLIPVGGITEDSDLVLANAVYFKGLWKSSFDSANSKKDNFYSNGERTSLVTFMKQKGTFSHTASEEIGAHVLQLPYKGDTISMYILLPPFARARNLESEAGPDSVLQLIERITKTERAGAELRAILEEGLPPREVEILLPKFSVDKELPVGQLLNAMGAGDLLTSAADLRGLLADGEPSLHLGDAVHRAIIEVTEEGTKAAAATALFSFRSSRPAEPAVFKADHPFLYFIYDRSTHSILFSGIYRIPPGAATAATYA